MTATTTAPAQTTTAPKITDASRVLFLELAKDAGNWGGTPPTDGNVEIGSAGRGNLTQLKRAGLLTTFRSDGDTWIDFTQAGKDYAIAQGVDLSWLTV